MRDELVSVREACLDVFRFEPRITGEDRVGCVAGGQHPKHVLDGQPMAANDWLSGEDRRIHCDPRQECLLVHAESIDPSRLGPVPTSRSPAGSNGTRGLIGEEGVSRALRVFPDSGRQAILSSFPAPAGGERCLPLPGRRGQAEADDLSRELVDVIARTFVPQAGSHDVNQPGGRINRRDQAVSLANHPKASMAHEVFPERLSLLLRITLQTSGRVEELLPYSSGAKLGQSRILVL